MDPLFSKAQGRLKKTKSKSMSRGMARKSKLLEHQKKYKSIRSQNAGQPSGQPSGPVEPAARRSRNDEEGSDDDEESKAGEPSCAKCCCCRNRRGRRHEGTAADKKGTEGESPCSRFFSAVFGYENRRKIDDFVVLDDKASLDQSLLWPDDEASRPKAGDYLEFAPEHERALSEYSSSMDLPHPPEDVIDY